VKPLGLSLGQAVLRSCIKNRTLDFQISLWGKEWFWNISDCWKNYPHHTVDRDVWWYYITELSFYWGLFFSQFVDVRRKDFWVLAARPRTFGNKILNIFYLTMSKSNANKNTNNSIYKF
jgi:hypothetical protein